jgi:hypothetical protein
LQSYLEKYWNQFKDHLVPTTPPTLPPDVDPTAYKRVAFSVQPLLANDVSPYYAGKFDDDTDFSASLVKVAALFAAGQLLAEAKVAAAGAANSASFLSSFNTAVQGEVNANADPRITGTHFTSTSPVPLMPNIPGILDVTGFPSVTFKSTFASKQSLMIVQSDDPAAGFCIGQLGYGYISAALNQKKFFDASLTAGPDTSPPPKGRGVWLTANYDGDFKERIPCVNDHPDAQLTTARQMCRMFSMIRLKKLPENDPDTNTLMQNLLKEPKAGGTSPLIQKGRAGGGGPSVDAWFTFVLDKIGFAGLGAGGSGATVYSEGLIIQWNNPNKASQLDDFNNKIDPGNSNPSTRLSGEIAVCWQNVLWASLPTGFDGIVEVLNNTISDFLDQKAL